jgi:hypothetical protein
MNAQAAILPVIWRVTREETVGFDFVFCKKVFEGGRHN